MKKIILKWLDEKFGSFPDWSDLKLTSSMIKFQTRYGLVGIGSTAQGEICYNTDNQKLYLNVSSDPNVPMWHEII